MIKLAFAIVIAFIVILGLMAAGAYYGTLALLRRLDRAMNTPDTSG